MPGVYNTAMILRVHAKRFLCLTTLVGLILAGCCTAFATSQVNYDADLATLENRFFLHTYPGDTVSERLDRLDELVYGRVRQGSNQTRMTSLLMALPSGSVTSPESSTGSKAQSRAPALESEKPVVAAAPPASEASPAGPTATSGSSGSAVSSNSPNAPGSSPDSSAPGAAGDSGQSIDYYPTVTALEKKIAGKTEVSWPVQERLARLEKIAFGKTSTSDDLSHRVDLLKQYVRSKYGGNEDYLASSNAVGWADGSSGLESEVASMEQEVFGKTYASDNLSSRLTRLEKNVLPKQPAQTFTPIAFRVNRLMAALNPKGARWSTAAAASGGYPAATTGTSSPVGQITPFTNTSAPGYYPGPQSVLGTAQNSQSAKSKHHFLHKLGIVAGAVGGFAVRSLMYGGGYGYGYW